MRQAQGAGNQAFSFGKSRGGVFLGTADRDVQRRGGAEESSRAKRGWSS